MPLEVLLEVGQELVAVASVGGMALSGSTIYEGAQNFWAGMRGDSTASNSLIQDASISAYQGGALWSNNDINQDTVESVEKWSGRAETALGATIAIYNIAQTPNMITGSHGYRFTAPKVGKIMRTAEGLGRLGETTMGFKTIYDLMPSLTNNGRTI